MNLPKILLTLLLICLSLATDEPRFETGALEQLTCEVVERKPAPWGVRLLLEVRNTGTLSAEPLSFAISFQPKKKKTAATETRVDRVLFPFARRFGRGVAPKGKERYWVQVALLPDDGAFEARVTRATWFEGSSSPRPGVTVGMPRQGDLTNQQGQKIDATIVKLKNPEARDIDLVFLADFKEPRDGQALLGVRVRASSEREWIISELPSQLKFSEETGFNSVKVTKLELVDWCWVGTPDPEADKQMFRSVYESWVRWQKPYQGLSGRYRYRSNGNDHDLRSEGTFRLDSEGVVKVVVEQNAGSQDRSELEKLVLKEFNELLFDVRRASADEVLAKSRVKCVSDDAFELDGPGWWRGESTGWSGSTSGKDGEFLPNFTVRDGRICNSGRRDNMADHTWGTRLVPGGWVLTERRNSSDQWLESYEYSMLDDLVVPVAYRNRRGFLNNGPVYYVSLELSALRRENVTSNAAAPAPPSGPGVDALRAAWEYGYRYPDTPRVLTANFEVHTPATDLVWQGQKEVRGKVRLDDYRGFRCDRASWSEYHIDVAGKFPEETRSLLAAVVDDRLGLWSFRDFNGRSEFSEAMAGATIEAPAADGTMRISGSKLESVLVQDGRVVAKTLRGGATMKFTWSKVGEQMLVTRTQFGGEDLRVKFSKVGSEFAPTSMEFLQVFGKDWGPETLVLKDVEIK